MSDSAGVPWAGRHFEPPASTDDGAAPARLIEAIRRFRSRELGEVEVIDALRGSRLLIPLVSRVGEVGLNNRGVLVDKTQELSIVTVSGPDGRTVLPVFSSVDTMRHWDPQARPIPADAVRIAVAAASEQTDLVILDPTSWTEFVIRRPALLALAGHERWTPSYLDARVLDAFMATVEPEPVVVAVQLAPGDPDARLAGPELVVQLSLLDGLDRDELEAVVSRLRARWEASEVIAERVDSLRVQLASA